MTPRAAAERRLAEKIFNTWYNEIPAELLDLFVQTGTKMSQLAARESCDEIARNPICFLNDSPEIDWDAICPVPDNRPWHERMGESPDCFQVYPPEDPDASKDG